jgi:hypothetical protein
MRLTSLMPVLDGGFWDLLYHSWSTKSHRAEELIGELSSLIRASRALNPSRSVFEFFCHSWGQALHFSLVNMEVLIF